MDTYQIAENLIRAVSGYPPLSGNISRDNKLVRSRILGEDEPISEDNRVATKGNPLKY